MKNEGLKLFVVGESSTDPEKWGEYGNRAVVIAHNADEARAIVGDLTCGYGSVTEIDLANETPKMLLSEADYGEFPARLLPCILPFGDTANAEEKEMPCLPR